MILYRSQHCPSQVRTGTDFFLLRPAPDAARQHNTTLLFLFQSLIHLIFEEEKFYLCNTQSISLQTCS